MDCAVEGDRQTRPMNGYTVQVTRQKRYYSLDRKKRTYMHSTVVERWWKSMMEDAADGEV